MYFAVSITALLKKNAEIGMFREACDRDTTQNWSALVPIHFLSSFGSTIIIITIIIKW